MSEKSTFEMQLDARTEWLIGEITCDHERQLYALVMAYSSGMANEEKTVFLKNTAALSDSYDEGRADSSVDYAIAMWEEHGPMSHFGLEQYGREICPTVGKTYKGKLVHGDKSCLYQSAKIGRSGVRHNRDALYSSMSGTLMAGHHVNIHYTSDQCGFAAKAP